MLNVRRGQDRGHFNHGWLNTYHTFSFADYDDANWRQFRSLRVMNEDVIGAGQGFGMHGHRDMEIVTLVLEGELAHRDSLGHESIIRPGELQRMSAGTGIRHSEFNPSPKTATHLYQIWLFPRRTGLAPGYEQQPWPDPDKNGWRLLAHSEGKGGALTIQQDADIWLGAWDTSASVAVPINRPYGWLQVLAGRVAVAGQSLQAGDGVAVSQETSLELASEPGAKVLWFGLN